MVYLLCLFNFYKWLNWPQNNWFESFCYTFRIISSIVNEPFCFQINFLIFIQSMLRAFFQFNWFSFFFLRSIKLLQNKTSICDEKILRTSMKSSFINVFEFMSHCFGPYHGLYSYHAQCTRHINYNKIRMNSYGCENIH